MIEKITKSAGISKAAAAQAYDSFLGFIKGGLKTRGSKVNIFGFGTLKKVYRKPRKGRNAVTFKASKNLV